MKKIHFITQGCSANQADTEAMAGLLIEQDYMITEDLDSADLVIFNTCTVKGPTENNFKRKLKEIDKLGKKVVVAGCFAQAQKDDPIVKKYSCIGPRAVENIVEIVERTLEGEIITNLTGKGKVSANLPKKRKNPIIEIISISQGCLGSCSYCKTKQARGNLVSVPVKEIIDTVKKAVSEGVKEIWLTSQDNGCYGKDIGTNLVELLKKVVKIKGNFKVRIGMANPNFVYEFLEDLIEIMKNEKVYKFLHLPLQSGNNQVLEDMKRQYLVEDFIYIIDRLKKEIPSLNILTDIICGYPTETKEQFEDTLRIIEQTKPDLINISRFWPRPNTFAAGLKKVPTNEMKRRTREMTELFHKIALIQNNKWIGWEGKALVDEKRKEASVVARNKDYRQIIIKEKLELGEEVKIRITGCTKFYLEGIIVH